ncbi:hypothetical protein F5Y16DRAFT_395184 [Xylariaceae sp. FL0255]|nr:hypothetical protein F5Y16DRAFT_395184 [Xylariaceae sp. FL0255]
MAYEDYERASQERDKRIYIERWQSFLFYLACATSHEIAHIFTLYLSLYADFPPTPPSMCYSNVYRQDAGGESGRWLEGLLFGGCLEIYKDRTQGPKEAGTYFLVDQQNIFRRIDPGAILEFLKGARQYRFPFPVGPPQRYDDLRRQGLRNVGSTDAVVPVALNLRAMQSLSAMRRLRGYSIHIDGLRQRISWVNTPLRVSAA